MRRSYFGGERKVALRSDLDDARRLLKEMNKKPATSNCKKAKAEPKKSMKKT